MKTFLVPAIVNDNGRTRKVLTKVSAENEYQAELITVGLHGVRHEGEYSIFTNDLTVVVLAEDVQEYCDATNS